MLNHERWRISDQVFIGLGIFVLLVTWGMTIYFYPDLPETVPTQYGFDGQVDSTAAKSIWVVFLPALIQASLTIGVLVLYRHPRYASIPGSVLIDLAPEPIRSRLLKLMKHSLVVTMVLMNLVFAYVSLTSISHAFGLETGLNGLMIGTLIVLVVVINILYTVWFYRLARNATKQPPGSIDPKIRLAQGQEQKTPDR